MKWETPKQHLRKLRIKRILYKLKCIGLTMLFITAIFILFICITSGNDTEKLNKCLQNHNLDYCNRNI